MKLLFAIKTLDNAAGGAERVLADITGGLSDQGHDITIVSFDAPVAKSFYPLNEKINWVQLSIGDVTNKSKFTEAIKRIIALRRFAAEHKPDVAIGFMHSIFVPLSFALIGTRIPVIASEHISYAYYKINRLEFLSWIFSYIFVKKMTVISSVIKAQYPKIFQRKMIAITNPVNIHVADNLVRQNDSKIILSVGRLEPQKDHETLIRAFALISSELPDWSLHIYGQGSLKNKIKELIDTLNLSERVVLKGVTDDISSVYARAAFLVVPSRYESFGLVSLEAMAHGVPVIGFADCPGTNEVIHDGVNGILVDVCGREMRESSLAKAMRSMMLGPKSFEYKEDGVRKILSQYEIKTVVSKWKNTIQSILA